MVEKRLGKLVRVDPRTVWAHEALEFTPWLARNLPELNEALGIEIELVDQEVAVGAFAVDIFGRELGSGHEIIIENQLEATDHGHLGQLLTYAAGLDAKVVVWISPQFRDEHKQALDWLNRDTTESLSFFGVELELFQIGNSDPAPNFKVVAQPSEWQRHVAAATKGQHSERQLAYHEFFSDLLERLKSREASFTNVRRVGFDSWISLGAGRTGFGLNAAIAKGNRLQVQIHISTGDTERNKRGFDDLHSQKGEIEAAVGVPLVWERLDEGKDCRIYLEYPEPTDPADRSPDVLDWAVEHLLKFRTAFNSRIRALSFQEAGPLA